MECEFRDQADLVGFAFSLDGRSWTTIGRPHHLRYDLRHFMGCRFGLFNFATQTAGGHVDFDYFHVADRVAFPGRSQ
jgi:hypothetical protein